MKNEKTMSWEMFLKKTLTWYDYENMHTYLNETLHMTTRIKNNSGAMHFQHLTALSELLKKYDPSYTADWIMEKYLNIKSKTPIA
jgi:hypothetical protein